MADTDFELANYEKRMRGVFDNLKKDFGGLRTGACECKPARPACRRRLWAEDANQSSWQRVGPRAANDLRYRVG